MIVLNEGLKTRRNPSKVLAPEVIESGKTRLEVLYQVTLMMGYRKEGTPVIYRYSPHI